MKVYADYNFYMDNGGTMTKDAFEVNAKNASQYLRLITLNKSDSYEGEELKYAACEIAEIYNSINGESKNRVKSENNDGFSVTFTSEWKDGETAEQFAERKSYVIAKRWLLLTGLLNRKVDCCHDYKLGYHNL